MLPNIVGCDVVVAVKVLGALARRDHLEPAGARPVHLLMDQSRLVAIGQRIDDTRLACAFCQQRTR